MNDKKNQNGRQKISRIGLFAGLCSTLILATAYAADEPVKADAKPAEAKTVEVKKSVAKKPAAKRKQAKKPAASSSMAYAPQVNVALNKSTLIKLPSAANRVSVGNPEIADVILLGDKEIYLLGKKVGATNIIVWGPDKRSRVMDVSVGMDFTALQAKLRQLLPGSRNINVSIANDSLVLSGSVPDAVKVEKAIALAEAYAGKKVVNLLQAGAAQQVMLEVKVAEVSKTLLDQLGVKMGGELGRATFLSSFLTGDANLKILNRAGTQGIWSNAQKNDELVKILAEPTIMALNGQEGAFLAGGKIYIPVPQSSSSGTTFTMEEKEFGIGLKFTPTVLEGGLIHLRVTPEVSELSTTGTLITANSDQVAASSVSVLPTTTTARMLLPTITTRRASTTVQLYDGQSFAIGGLIKSKTTESMKAFPWLGEIPVLGALFRSAEFQNEKTELLFVITPRLVKSLPPNYVLPTDNITDPNSKEFFLDGKMEGPPVSRPADTSAPVAPIDDGKSSRASGFQMK